MHSSTLTIAEETCKYFCRKYEDRDASVTLRCDKCWQSHIIHRPNHGLCHGIRQGLLAVRIANMIDLNCDLYKLQAAASFQRSGRQSEISSAKNPQLYQSYEEADVKNCLLFLGDTECCNAIRWNCNTDIAKVIHAAHHLDLRRIPSFSEKIIKQNIRDLLPLTDAQLEKLWSYAGRLLHATGDRCLCCQKVSYAPIFARLSNQPKDLALVLVAVK